MEGHVCRDQEAETMNALIERYIHQVREHLPERLRDDVARELHSLILDTVDDRARQHGMSDEVVVEVLHEFGEPSAAARRYAESIDGPSEVDWLPVVSRQARRAASFVALALAAMWAMFMLIAFVTQPGGWRGLLSPSQLGQWLFSYVVTLAINLGVLAALFAAFGARVVRFAPPLSFDPRQLPAVPVAGTDRVARGWVMAFVAAAAIVLIVLNLTPQWFGLPSATTDGDVSRFTIMRFSEIGLQVPLGLLSAWWAAAGALAIAALLLGRWTRALTAGVLLLEFAGAALFFYVASTSDPSSAAPQLVLIGRLAVAVLVANGVVLLVSGLHGVWTRLRPHGAHAQPTLA
jgi:hypothetical protein